MGQRPRDGTTLCRQANRRACPGDGHQVSRRPAQRDRGDHCYYSDRLLESAPATLDQLRTAVREGNADGVARAAHELKSASFNVAATSMAAVCRELEASGRSGSTEGAAALMAQLDELFPAVQAELEARLEQESQDNVVSA